jgi:WD40 repeat protein
MAASSAVQSIALSPDESVAACGLIDGKLAIFDLASGRRLIEYPAHRETINAVAFDPNKGMLATASRDKTVGLWRVDGSALVELARLPSPSGRPVLSVRFSHDGRFLGMLAHNERGVRVWDLDKLRSRPKEIGLDWK